MNLAEFFDPDLIDIDLKAGTKLEAVECLTELFCRKYPGKDKYAILQAVMEREELGTTSLGRGFAFPHARTVAVNDLHIAFGIIRNGVADRGPDGVPLKAICLLLTPRNISKLYLQTLSGLANFARRPGVLDAITRVHSPAEFIEVVAGTGIEVKSALTVGDIMSEHVIAVAPDDSLKKVANIFFKFKFDGIPVVDSSGNLVGEVSERDLLRSAVPDFEALIPGAQTARDLEPFEDLLRHEDMIRVKDVMNREVATISDTAQVIEAAARMLARNTERLMVVRDNRLVGIISRSDIISKIIRG